MYSSMKSFECIGSGPIFRAIVLIALSSPVMAASLSFDNLRLSVTVGSQDAIIDYFGSDSTLIAVIPAWFGASLNVYRDTGDLYFQEISSTVAPDNHAYTIRAGDFNNDGSLDVAVVYPDVAVLGIFLNDGTGSFSLSSSTQALNNPVSVETADLNNDGKLDFVVSGSNPAPTFNILFGDGTGGIASDTIITGGSWYHYSVLGDFDLNGFVDIAITDYNVGFSIFSNSNGVFSKTNQVNLPAGNPYDISAGYINGDSLLDIAFCTRSSSSTYIFLNEGGGVFTSPISTVIFGATLDAIKLADLDNDGDADLLISTFESGTTVFENDGLGSYLQCQLLPQRGVASVWRGICDSTLHIAIPYFAGQFIRIAQNLTVQCPDSDSDGTCDKCDVCSDGSDTVDSDGDSIPDGCDLCSGFDDNADSDSDGVPDGCDICPGFDDSLDTDADGVPDGCDICEGFDDNVDADSDGVTDGCDACPGFDDSINNDSDSLPDLCDNCPNTTNEDQFDSDDDGVGNVCDICAGFDDNIDTDSDGTPDGCDTCPTNPNPCCCAFAGDADSGGDTNIGDATFIVKYIFQNGDSPPCLDQADADGGGDVNIGDATYLVKFIFQSGLDPVCGTTGS